MQALSRPQRKELNCGFAERKDERERMREKRERERVERMTERENRKKKRDGEKG